MPNLPWYVYVFFAVSLVVWLLRSKFLKKTTQAVKILRHKDYTKNPEGTTLSSDQQKALAVGLINSEQTMCYVDTLTTGMSPKTMTEMLESYWGITNRESACQTLDWLLQFGHRKIYDVILPLILNNDYSADKIKVILPEENHDQAVEFLHNLKECIAQFEKHPDFPYSHENLKNGIAGWDAGRLVTVARVCCDKEYINEKEAWEYIYRSYKMVEQYADWKGFATSYVIGRGMWGGNSMSYDGICSIALQSLTKPESPWVTIKFK